MYSISVKMVSKMTGNIAAIKRDILKESVIIMAVRLYVRDARDV